MARGAGVSVSTSAFGVVQQVSFQDCNFSGNSILSGAISVGSAIEAGVDIMNMAGGKMDLSFTDCLFSENSIIHGIPHGSSAGLISGTGISVSALNANTLLTFDGCSIRNNILRFHEHNEHAAMMGSGAGIHLKIGGSSDIKFNECHFIGNSIESAKQSSGSGLAILVYGPVESIIFKGCILERNSIKSVREGVGSGIALIVTEGHSAKHLEISRSILRGNTITMLPVRSSDDMDGGQLTFQGGGAYISGFEGISINGCKVEHNSIVDTTLGRGGGIAVFGGKDLTIKGDSHFSKNYAHYEGGSLWVGAVDNVSIMEGVMFMFGQVGSTSMVSRSSVGGAMFVDSTRELLLMGVFFRGNYAAESGGALTMTSVFNNRRSKESRSEMIHGARIVNCTFEENSAGRGGGALHTFGQNIVTIDGCSFLNNTSIGREERDGGGALRLTVCTAHENIFVLGYRPY